MRSKSYFLIAVVLTIISAFTLQRSGTPYPFEELKYFPKKKETSNPATVEGAELGRFLFYDPVLSRDSSISCASCHKRQYAFSDSPNSLSKGIDGLLTTRNTMPLFNLAWYDSFFWDGRASSIENQAFVPVRNHAEMDLSWPEAEKRIRSSTFYRSQFKKAFGTTAIDSVSISLAIGQFERTLISNHSKFDQVIAGQTSLTSDEYDGFVLMNDQTKGDCLHCHTTDGNSLGTTGKFSNNGLDSVLAISNYKDPGKGGTSGVLAEVGQFKIPSLRNVAVTGPYMHDGRFTTLEQVLDFYSEGVHPSINVDSKMGFASQGGAHLSESEKAKIIAFLHTLTDTTFLTNPEFSNPF